MDKLRESTEYATDYLDIVNEINDFIASLDAPPLDSHTKDLVGERCTVNTFGQCRDEDISELAMCESWTGSKSRHTSGEKSLKGQSCINNQQSDTSFDVLGNSCDNPFPLTKESEPGFSNYDYVCSDISRTTDFGDYSDCSNYAGTVSESSSCDDMADNDSGCYSHYRQSRGNPPQVHREYVGVSASPVQLVSSFSPELSPTPPFVSGDDRGTYQLSSSSANYRQLPFLCSSVRPQSPDRLSAEFHCDSSLDSLDQRFHQVGSSAYTLTASSENQNHANQDYQELSNIPEICEFPVPQRKSQTKPVKYSEDFSVNSPNPVSNSPHPSPKFRECPHNVSQKKSSNPHPTQGLSVKNRWLIRDTEDFSPLSSSDSVKLQGKSTLKEETQPHLTDVHAKAEESGVTWKHPITIPIQRVPDLSVLITELRSASPRSEVSSHSTYTSSARSESVSPISLNRPKINAPVSRHPRPHSPKSKAEAILCNKDTEEESQAHHHQSRQVNHSQRHKSTRSQSHSPTHKQQQEAASVRKQQNSGVRCRSDSPEHDYEPIENLQLEVPATPRPQTKFPHPQGSAMAETGGQQPKHVKALHNFKGANNDELCFKKGDIITVTQCIEGGWWEGTLNGRTGWFPSNYTKEVKADISYKNNKNGDVPVYKRESMQLYHNVVLKNVIETEKTHVNELIKVLQSFLKPIETTSILTPPEYTLLVGNLEEIIAFQQSFLAALEECEKLPSSQRRIGGIFMQFAASVKELYSSYCANHPKAVSVLQKKREELSKFVESQGAPAPGAQTLTTILSKPFTRLDKYPSLLKELERHVEESHPDRGDTQRAIAVYRNIANSCLEIRKLKEMEHEIITSTIQGWEGEEISKLGEVIHLSQVKMVNQKGEKYDRIFVLFSSCLVMLSMSTRLSSYQYEGKIPLSGLCASPSENTESFQNAFEISGPMIEKITVLCGTKLEVTSWLEILNQQLAQSGNPSSSAKPQSLQMHMISTCQPSVSTVTPAKTAQISSNPPTAPPPQFPTSNKTSCVWSLTCLRPSPPLRPTLMCREEVLKSPRAVRKSTHKRKPVRTYSGEDTDWHSKNDPKVYNEDAFILQVIEAYCNSVKTRHTVNSSILNSPQIILAEEEKIFDDSEQQERTVVDTVYALQDRVKELEQEQRKLRQDLEEEKRCRKKLEMLVRQQVIKSGIVDGVQDSNS